MIWKEFLPARLYIVHLILLTTMCGSENDGHRCDFLEYETTQYYTTSLVFFFSFRKIFMMRTSLCRCLSISSRSRIFVTVDAAISLICPAIFLLEVWRMRNAKHNWETPKFLVFRRFINEHFMLRVGCI